MKAKEKEIESAVYENENPTLGDLAVVENSNVEVENISEELERKLEYNACRETRAEYDVRQVEADNPEMFEEGIVAQKKPLGEIRRDKHGRLDVRSHAEEKLGHPVGERPKQMDDEDEVIYEFGDHSGEPTIPNLVRWEDEVITTLAWKRAENGDKTVIEPEEGFPRPEGMKEVVVPSSAVEHYRESGDRERKVYTSGSFEDLGKSEYPLLETGSGKAVKVKTGRGTLMAPKGAIWALLTYREDRVNLSRPTGDGFKETKHQLVRTDRGIEMILGGNHLFLEDYPVRQVLKGEWSGVRWKSIKPLN